jgi:hypothetical protein
VLLDSLGFEMVTLIFPTAVIVEYARVGRGCIVRHQAVVSALVLGPDNAYVGVFEQPSRAREERLQQAAALLLSGATARAPPAHSCRESACGDSGVWTGDFSKFDADAIVNVVARPALDHGGLRWEHFALETLFELAGGRRARRRH